MARIVASLLFLPLLASSLLTLVKLFLRMETTTVELAPTIGATLHFALYIFVVLLMVSIPMVALGRLADKSRVWHAIASGLVLGIVLAQLFHDKAAISLTEHMIPALAIITVATSLSLTLWVIGFRGNYWFQRRATSGL